MQNSSAALRKTRCLPCRFSDFYSIAARRSLCTTFVTNYCGQHQRCLVHGRRISKYKYICFCYPSSMDRCSASARSLRFLLWWCISTAAWRLLVQTCCQKSEKTTADNSDNARAADLQKQAAMIFRGVIQGRTFGMMPLPCAYFCFYPSPSHEKQIAIFSQ